MAKKEEGKGLIGNILLSNIRDVIMKVSETDRLEVAIQELFPDMPATLVTANAEYFGQKTKDVFLPLVK